MAQIQVAAARPALEETDGWYVRKSVVGMGIPRPPAYGEGSADQKELMTRTEQRNTGLEIPVGYGEGGGK